MLLIAILSRMRSHRVFLALIVCLNRRVRGMLLLVVKLLIVCELGRATVTLTDSIRFILIFNTAVTIVARCAIVGRKRIVPRGVLLPGIFKFRKIRHPRAVRVAIRRVVGVIGDLGERGYIGRGSKCVPNWSQCAAGLCKHHAKKKQKNAHSIG